MNRSGARQQELGLIRSFYHVIIPVVQLLVYIKTINYKLSRQRKDIMLRAVFLQIISPYWFLLWLSSSQAWLCLYAWLLATSGADAAPTTITSMEYTNPGLDAQIINQ
jgi:hypothetical protein